MTLSFRNALFISDIHLTADRPDCVRAFFAFLDWIPSSTDALFILGDFFEYWLGDDISTPLTEQVAQALRRLSESHDINVFYIPGNRDFALGKDYCNAAGMTLLGDETTLTIADKRVSLSHGDIYCTDDKQYQRFRKVIRNPFILGTLKKLPKSYRKKLAEKLRANSKQRFSENPVYIDVTESAITEALGSLRCDVLVHGHTHMADIHSYEHNQLRMVLGDWDKLGWYGKIDENTPTLHQFSISDPSF
ncbi:UDP-2,3-diacylglucosamine diphosphatase [Reinekea marinisedimentorum]|uniref:UDP-2,3-diacylglucosamine hydrolase n=1 Tax=Reinekea marinisedimentorum TaxID=230495 RepID=A0A4R3IAX3_9GAMM|nr:UDP-2,3-diacylglucosamine diphosphatase [Reinekea marinisedimentorum]TCS42590.1 UDP-2,3-diacylglucosamine hydrolase [Reinekea marinisedimentorum]